MAQAYELFDSRKELHTIYVSSAGGLRAYTSRLSFRKETGNSETDKNWLDCYRVKSQFTVAVHLPRQQVIDVLALYDNECRM